MPRLSTLAVVFAAALVLPPIAAAASSPAVVTILEGSAIVFRGTSKLGASEGVRIQPNDLVETGKDTYARLEFDDGTRLDLGPGTRLQVNNPGETTGDRPALYLLAGWIKLSVDDSKHPRGVAFATPVFDGAELGGVVLAHVDARGGSLFVEQGRARIANRHVRVPAPRALKSSDFASIAREGKVVIDTRPSSEFVDQMPRAFRDSIPSRLGLYREREVAPKALGDFSYGDVEAWLDAEPSVRRQFVHTWRPKADETAFRILLTAKISLHPEWGPVLFPELYAPKLVGPPWPLPEHASAPH
jgi:FecR protein